MKNRITKILFWLMPFVAGTIIGAAAVVFWSVKSIEVIKSTTDLNYLTYEIEVATDQYFNSPNIDTGIYALEHLIRFKKDFYIHNVSKNYFHDLAVAYVRLGNLYEKKGDKQSSTRNFQKGFEIAHDQELYEKWKGTEKEIKNVDDLKKFVEDLDDRSMRK